MTTMGRTWRKRKRERPDEIRAAALNELLHGANTMTMKSIAHRAGIAKGTIYLYFRNKKALLDAVREP